MPESSTLVTGLIAVLLMLLGTLARAALRERLHPAVVYPVQWGGVLLLIIAAAPLGFYSVTPAAAAVFFAGAAIFIAGSILGDRVAKGTSGAPLTDPWDRLNYRQLFVFCIVLHAMMLPVWWQEMVTIAGESSDLVVIGFRVRWKTVTGEANVSSLVGNYLVLGFIMVPVLAMGAFRGRASVWMALAVGAPWLAANLFANGRASLVQLILALAYLRATEKEPISARAVAAGLLIFFAIFGGGVILAAKGDTSIEDGASLVVMGVISNLSDYLLQGPVLFSRYLNGETGVTSSWDALSFPCSLLQMAGLCTLGELHQEFAEFGRFDQFGNVYTVYFSVLPKYGPIGFVLIIAAYGAWTAWHHRRHRQGGSVVHSLLAAYLFSAVPLSIFSDLFAPNLNMLIKTAIIAALLQRFVSKRPAAKPSHAAIQLRGHS